jgi:hypothetical protein
MARAELIWPYVEKTLYEFLGDRMKVVDEHMVSVQQGSSNVLIRLLDSDEPRLQVFSLMLQGVKETPELLEVLNGLTAGLAFAKIFWVDDDVVVATELLAESLDRDSLNAAVGVIAGAADRFDDELKARFGGETAFPQPPAEAEGKGGGEPSQSGADEDHEEGVPEGIGLPPGMEHGEPAKTAEPSADDAPPEEDKASAKTERDPDEAPGYL